ncbi:hypothetical protein Tdes44962_MAKER04194 [Teratosphaeria destructans]|uniref:CID domain-containing protein n=1 Tax=Teratosphaeria destructans TaxID=418781 RepID=A0A9W7SN70_9PEZI|nr:hypothetical protein Tdes44962_MAKER04194 [Teratosphaeria destructans]
MAYSDDAVRHKLSSLNETQDSITTNAQWIMFHRRHADRTASVYLDALKANSTPAKRLNLIYLANEVVQQSRARGKRDFMLAFEPIIAEATGLAFRGASQDIQGKIKRVVDVWKQRQIFDAAILRGVDERIAEIERSKTGQSEKKKLGGSLFGQSLSGGLPQELDALSKSQVAVNKAEAATGPARENAEKEYAKTTDSTTPLPTAPVRAHRLTALVKHLVKAEEAVEASIQARKELLASLERLIESNRAKLTSDEALMADLSSKKDAIETTRKEVEDSIMRGTSTPATPTTATSPQDPTISNGANGHSTNGGAEPTAPEAEGFTPPPPDVESFTPPPPESGMDTGISVPQDPTPSYAPNPSGAEIIQEEPPNFNEPAPAYEPPPAMDTAADAANQFLENLANERVRQASGEAPADPRLKRRKMSHPKPAAAGELDEDLFGSGVAGAGVDEDGVAALLGRS